MTGCRPLPKPNDSSAYGGVGRVTASAPLGGDAGCAGRAAAAIACANANASYSSQGVSVRSIQNGAMRTSCAGPSSAARPGSDAGLPITNVPPGIATMSNVIFVPEIVSVYDSCAARCVGRKRTKNTRGLSALSIRRLVSQSDAGPPEPRRTDRADRCATGVEVLVERIFDRHEQLGAAVPAPPGTRIHQGAAIQREVIAVIVELRANEANVRRSRERAGERTNTNRSTRTRDLRHAAPVKLAGCERRVVERPRRRQRNRSCGADFELEFGPDRSRITVGALAQDRRWRR